MEITTGLSKNTIMAYRKLIIEQIKNSKDQLFEKIGGPGIEVEIEETAIFWEKNNITSSTLDDEDEIQWIVGGIEETEENFFSCYSSQERSCEYLRSAGK
ncbi:hypothetical protein DMUE_4968 [Dictyocoela muelleri]|nr:hypothetical protein DMUE_4968 [Dictyocoela muelleri]